GIITDRDITCRVTADDRDPRTTTAKTIMTSVAGRCFENDSLAEAAKIMMEMRVRRLPVFSRGEDFVGVLSVGDLSAHTNHALLGEVMGTLYEAHK
ncbi:MAG: CBS domain-containing protein, partial [Planctomycetales bacterium]